jgi:MoxR-like ATPase
MTNLAEKVRRLEASVANEIQERDAIAHTGVLALVTRENHFQVGVPGIAKSMIVERIIARIDGFGPHDYFHRLMSRQMPEDKLFGPPDLGEMQVVVIDGKRTGGVVKRDTSRHLPAAKIAFLDEIFKCSEGSLNALLNALNERIFDDEIEGQISIPLMSTFAASNELQESDMLDALWDRFLFRHHAQPIQDMSSMKNMLMTQFEEDVEKIITLDELTAAQAEVNAVEIPEKVIDAILTLKDNLSEVGVNPSDRRWRAALKAVRAEAWLDGCSVAEIIHTRPLEHVLWYTTANNQPRTVSNAVLDLADPIERQIKEFLQELLKFEEDYHQVQNSDEEDQKRRRHRVEVYGKIEELEDEFEAVVKGATERNEVSPRTEELVANFRRRFLELHENLITTFGTGGRKSSYPRSV